MKIKSSANDFILHASAVVAPLGAVLFSGPSGAGKSTMAALVSRHTGWPIMADDTTRLWLKDGAWVSENGCLAFIPAGGKCPWPFAAHRAVRVAAWFSIRQASVAACSPLVPREACARFVQAWLEVAGHSSPYDPINGLRMFSGAARLAKAIPAMTLDCTLGVDTVRLVCDTIEYDQS